MRLYLTSGIFRFVVKSDIPGYNSAFFFFFFFRGGCSSGRAGGLVIRRSQAQVPAPLGGTELHVEVSLSKILNPEVAPDVQMPSVRVLR